MGDQDGECHLPGVGRPGVRAALSLSMQGGHRRIYEAFTSKPLCYFYCFVLF